jgi:phosphoenolpyruvate synthase/pyruvate phosphate dikinase
VSKRTGSKFSMPGMMDTILNLGLNDKSVEALPSAAIILGSRGFLPAADSDVRQRRARH